MLRLRLELKREERGERREERGERGEGQSPAAR